jgi:hypothetical protein
MFLEKILKLCEMVLPILETLEGESRAVAFVKISQVEAQLKLQSGDTKAVEYSFNSNPYGYIKRTSTGGIKLILTSVCEERGSLDGHIMCRFSFYELIRSVYELISEVFML